MKETLPSITACFVAFARASSAVRPLTEPPPDDDVAVTLLPRFLRPLVPQGKAAQALARVALLGMIDHIALRTAAIDAEIAKVFPQIVLLGAGLDGRAYRLRNVGAARVFEVDHPASQSLKLGAVRGLSARSKSLAHVAADFMTDDLDAVLAAHGHDATLPTAWILEGVTMYLPEAMTERLLTMVGRRSAAGSILALSYMRPSARLSALLRRPIDLFLHLVGEPFEARFTPDEIARRVRAAGLEPRSDTSSVEWAARFGASATLGRTFRSERLLIATR